MKYKIGESCNSSEQCYNKNCINNICTPKKRKYKKKIGQDCVTDKSCYSGICTNEICVGKTRKKKIGEGCEDDFDCYNKNCLYSICTRKKRKYKRKLGEKCRHIRQCYSNSCENNVCTRRNKKVSNKYQGVDVNSVFDISPFEKSKSIVKSSNQTLDRQYMLHVLRGYSPNEEIYLSDPRDDETVKKDYLDYISRNKKNFDKLTKSKKLTITPPSSLNVNKYFSHPSSDELVKMHNDLSALGLKQEDFYYDICYFLKGLKRLIANSKLKNYEKKMYLLLPIIYPNDQTYKDKYYIQNQMTTHTFVKQIRDSKLGENKLDLCFDKTCYVGKGTFGRIYNSKFNNNKIVIKEPITREQITDKIHNDVFDENVIHSELYCGLRGRNVGMARIPKIVFMARLYMPNSQMKIITGLEKLEGDLNSFFKHVINKMSVEKVDKCLKDMLIQLCNLVEILQDNYNFHHRDLHSGNIMYRNIGSIDNPVYRWYIIDFGFTYLENNGVKYHSGNIGPYRKYIKPNFAHDLRMLFVYIGRFNIRSMSQQIVSKSKMIKLLSSLFISVRSEIMKNEMRGRKFHWHMVYDYFDVPFANSDKYTDPRKLRSVLDSF